MGFKVKRSVDKNTGTIYGVYFNELLIHKEYSRSAADQIVDKLKSGTLLCDILVQQIEHKSKLDSDEKISIEKIKSDDLKLKVIALQHEIAELSQAGTKEEKLDYQTINDVIRIMHDYGLECTQAIEFNYLVVEAKNKGFTYSKQLSGFIIQSNLQKKYPNISGVVKMKDADREWDFKGVSQENLCFSLSRTWLK